jgi:hypothetical protein
MKDLPTIVTNLPTKTRSVVNGIHTASRLLDKRTAARGPTFSSDSTLQIPSVVPMAVRSNTWRDDMLGISRMQVKSKQAC